MRNSFDARDHGLQGTPGEVSLPDVNSYKGWILLLTCWAGFLAPCTAQDLELPETRMELSESAPADGILDKAGLFQRNPTQKASILEMIRQLREERGFLLYLVTESVFVQGEIQAKASALHERWVPEGNGLVFIFEVDSRRLSVGQSYEQTVSEDGSLAGIPSYVIAAVINLAAEKAREQPGAPEKFIEVFFAEVAKGLNDYFRRRDDPLPEGRNLRLTLVVVGAAAALALIGMAAAWLLRKTECRDGGTYRFPECDTPERLGAPYGAGPISSRRFGRGAANR